MKTAILCIAIMLAICVAPLAAAEPQPQLTPADKVELQIKSHPRIHITADMIPVLKERAATTHKVFYDKLLTNAAALLRRRAAFPSRHGRPG